MENTKLQRHIIKTYEQMAITKKVYPTLTKLAHKAKVSRRYAHVIIKAYKTQNQVFGLK